MMNKIQDSGTLEEIDEIRYVVLGDPNKDISSTIVRAETVCSFHILKENVEKALRIMESFPKTRCIALIPNGEKCCENETLSRLSKDCKNVTEETYVMYIHTKGVTRDPNVYPGVNSWVDAILDGLTMYRHVCWNKLKYTDAVGSYVRGIPFPYHFSGNFWWSKSSHIASLNPITTNDFSSAEMWIIGSQPGTRWVNICECGMDTSFEYYNITSLSHYRSSVCFRHNTQPSPKPTLKLSEILYVDVGFDRRWMRGKLFSVGKNVILSLSTLGISDETDRTAQLYGVVKIVRVCQKSGEMLYFLENDIVDVVEGNE
jgi:hypothetical protein